MVYFEFEKVKTSVDSLGKMRSEKAFYFLQNSFAIALDCATSSQYFFNVYAITFNALLYINRDLTSITIKNNCVFSTI